MAVNWGVIGAGGIALRRTIPEGITKAKQKRTTATSEKIEVQPINMYKGEIEEFSECIERDLEPTISGEDGLWSQKVVLACYKSALAGKVVKL